MFAGLLILEIDHRSIQTMCEGYRCLVIVALLGLSDQDDFLLEPLPGRRFKSLWAGILDHPLKYNSVLASYWA